MSKHDEALGVPRRVFAGDDGALVLVASLDGETPRARSVAWGVARALAYELRAAQLGGVRTGHDPPGFVGLHGERPIAGALDRGHAIACVGLGVGGIREEIVRALDETFDGAASPALLPARVDRGQTEAYAYAFVRARRGGETRVTRDGAIEVTELARDSSGARAYVARGIPIDEPIAETLARVLSVSKRAAESRPSAPLLPLDFVAFADHGTARARLRVRVADLDVAIVCESSEVAPLPALAPDLSRGAPIAPFALVIASERGAPYAVARFVDDRPFG